MASRGFLGLMGCFVVMVVILTEGAAAVTHTVGDTTGWAIPPNRSFYENWADDKTFSVGDVLSFTWAGNHNVANVSEIEYEQCTKVTPIKSNSPSSLLFTLNTTGDHYFICTIETHCTIGQKLKVEVSNSNTTAGSPPSTTTPPSTPTPPSSTNTSSPSSSPSFAPIATLSAAISVLVFSFLA